MVCKFEHKLNISSSLMFQEGICDGGKEIRKYFQYWKFIIGYIENLQTWMIIIGFGLLKYLIKLNPKDMEMEFIKVLPCGKWNYPRFKLLLKTMGSQKERVFWFKLNFTQQMQLNKEHVQPTWHQKVAFCNHFAQTMSKKLGLGNLLAFHDRAN